MINNYSKCALIIYEIIIGIIIIIIDKVPKSRNKKPKKFKSKLIATTTFPKIINKGKSNGNVTKVPKTEPLVKLKAFPKLKTFMKI